MERKSLFIMLLMTAFLLLPSCNNNPNYQNNILVNQGTIDSPYSVSEILDIASSLKIGECTDQEYYVNGLVISRPTKVNFENKFSFIMSDSLESQKNIIVLFASSEKEVYKTDTVLLEAFVHRSSENSFELTGKKLAYDNYTTLNVDVISQGDYIDRPKYAEEDKTVTLLDMVSVLFSKKEHYPLSDEFIERYQQNSGGYIELAESLGMEVNRQKHSPNQKWHFFESWLLDNLKTNKLSWSDDAKSKVYTRLLCPELLLWIYEALDADPIKVKAAKEVAEQAKVDGTHISTMASNMRKCVPFEELKI